MSDIATYKFNIAKRDESFAFGFSVPAPIPFDSSEAIQIVSGEQYEGEYTITPTNETQILETNGLYMADNVTINPIPSNYGLITWNGSTLTVS